MNRASPVIDGVYQGIGVLAIAGALALPWPRTAMTADAPAGPQLELAPVRVRGRAYRREDADGFRLPVVLREPPPQEIGAPEGEPAGGHARVEERRGSGFFDSIVVEPGGKPRRRGYAAYGRSV